MKLPIPDLALVVLVGPSGCGKSTFARTHFRPTEVVSSDAFRAMVTDDEADQTATSDAFGLLHLVTTKRLARGRLTVVDATNVRRDARKRLIRLAWQHHVPPVAIVFDLPVHVCLERAEARMDRLVHSEVISAQMEQLRRGVPTLDREGFFATHVLSSPDDITALTIERVPLPPNRKHDHGPFDIVGDVHGCFDELLELLGRLGYTVTEAERREDGGPGYHVVPPTGRKLIFLGDLVDRGPKTAEVLGLTMGMVAAGIALCIPGNHDDKLRRALQGHNVRVRHGLGASLAQLEAEPPAFREHVATFIEGLVSHYVLDRGRLAVAHAGMKEGMQGRISPQVRDFALYGETTGERDEFGLPVRLNWAADYRGRSLVVYGHSPVRNLTWCHRTINIDTGCVFGGSLTALRYPELEFVSVPAKQAYAEPARPLVSANEIPLALGDGLPNSAGAADGEWQPGQVDPE